MFKNGTNILKNNTRLLHAKDSITFDVAGDRFPAPVAAGVTGAFTLTFNYGVPISVDFGDGTITPYDTVLSGSLYRWGMQEPGASVLPSTPPAYIFPTHIYTDLLPTHKVTIRYVAEALNSISLSAMLLPEQALGFVFMKHPNLSVFRLSLLCTTFGGSTRSITTLDLRNIELCKKLVDLGLQRCFHDTNSPYYGSIPQELLDRPLTSMQIGDFGMPAKNFTDNKIGAIATSACGDTLEFLSITCPLVDDNHGEGPLPANFSLISTLTTVYLETSHTRQPSTLNTMPWLLSTANNWSSDLSAWGDLSLCVNLKSLSTIADRNVPATAPPFLNQMPKLKTLDMKSVFFTDRAAGNGIDDFINSLYGVISTKSFGNDPTADFHGVTLRLDQALTSHDLQRPTGTKQQPAGYGQGSSNGTPASPMEKIWVLENQYQWTVKTV